MSYADRLNDIKKKAQMKAERFKNTLPKPVDIADQDRPWSAADLTSIPSPFLSGITRLTEDLPHIELKEKVSEVVPPSSSQKEPECIPNQTLTKGITKKTQKDYKGNTINADHSKVETTEKSEDRKGDTKTTQRGYVEGDTKTTQREHTEYKGITKGTIKGTHKGLQREHKNISQNEDIKEVQREHKYSHLRGWNKKIVDLIHDICRETVSKVTYPLTNNTISEMLNMPRHSVKTTMQRLKSKGHVIVTEFNDGRGGWSKYTLPDEFFNDIPQTERVLTGTIKGTQRDYKGNNKGNTQRDTNAPSSSSFKDLKETTTSNLSDEWNFDITPYARFGFTNSHIKQLAPLGVISPTDVEQSLIEFSYDFENNSLPQIKTTKINYLMWLFKNGHLYVSEGFKNEQDAMIAEMAKRAEAKRKNLLDAKFEAWVEALSDEERKEIEKKLPTYLMAPYRTHGISNLEVRKWMFNYYLVQVR